MCLSFICFFLLFFFTTTVHHFHTLLPSKVYDLFKNTGIAFAVISHIELPNAMLCLLLRRSCPCLPACLLLPQAIGALSAVHKKKKMFLKTSTVIEEATLMWRAKRFASCKYSHIKMWMMVYTHAQTSIHTCIHTDHIALW